MDAVATSGRTAIRAFDALVDGGPARQGAIGLVALAIDHVCELALRRIIPQDLLPLYVSPIAFAPEITVGTRLSAAPPCDTGARWSARARAGR